MEPSPDLVTRVAGGLAAESKFRTRLLLTRPVAHGRWLSFVPGGLPRFRGAGGTKAAGAAGAGAVAFTTCEIQLPFCAG